LVGIVDIHWSLLCERWSILAVATQW